MSKDKDTTYLENKVKFSESVLWRFQTNYFEEKGINAWVGNVPYYVTSNSLITFGYAQIAFRYIQESIKKGLIDPNETIYFMELGTGSGRFSYQFLTFFDRMHQEFNATFKYCYVMTDFTQSNLDYWEDHHQFKNFIDKGVLDFAIYCIGSEDPITLKMSKTVLAKGKVRNPIIAVANYIFDTVPHDCFRVENGELHEGLISAMTHKDNYISQTQVKELNGLKTTFDFEKIDTNYYQNNSTLNEILAEYKNEISTSTFLVPIKSLDCIDFLSSLTDGKLFIISADKGYTHVKSLENLSTPHVAFHGSLSVMVNFDCIKRYIEKKGGEVYLSTETEGMKVNIMSLGTKLADMPEVNLAYYEHATHFSTKDFLLVKNVLIKHAPTLDLQEFLSLLKMSYWDPDIFVSVAMEWAQKLSDASRAYLEELRDGMRQIYENYYYIPNYKNPLFELGHIYHIIGDLQLALDRYHESMQRFGEDTATNMNIGLCHYYLEDKAKARQHFERALELDPNNESAKEWISFVEDES